MGKPYYIWESVNNYVYDSLKKIYCSIGWLPGKLLNMSLPGFLFLKLNIFPFGENN